MKFRLSLIALVSAVSLPALATSGFTYVGGEAGFTTHAMPSATTRANVVRELAAWNGNPQSADGWRQVGGEAGTVYVGLASTATRAQVHRELMQARLNPLSAGGWADVGGEAGAVYVGPSGNAATAIASRSSVVRDQAGAACALEPASVALGRGGHRMGMGGAHC